MIGFALANQRFIAVDNIAGVIRSSAILGVMALGVTFVVIGGNLDPVRGVHDVVFHHRSAGLARQDRPGAGPSPAMFALTLCLGA